MIWPLNIFHKIRKQERRATILQIANELKISVNKIGFRDPAVDRAMAMLAEQLKDAANRIDV